MVSRLAFPVQPKDGSEPFGLDDAAGRAVLRWASQFNLGQTRALLRQVAARRSRALNDAAASGRKVLRMRAKPEWRLAVGLGNRANAHEIGFALHGTYGWPVIPGSSLKGLSAAWAAREEAEADPKDALRVLGAPRAGGGEPASRGAVCFLDAIPAGVPVPVEADVLTPHVKRYYETTSPDSSARPVPPAEYHNPVPVAFLTVGGAFAVDLIGGESRDLELAAKWLITSCGELGAGAKTAAGYGYMALTRDSERDGQ